MDTSKTYIKMCDCPEIQEKHEATEGDLCVIKFMGYSVELIIGQTPTRADKKDNRDLLKAGNTIWLPRQDQIQEMMNYNDSSSLIDAFCFWEKRAKNDYTPYFHGILKTFEQIWLAFYMYEKHKNVWSGKKWRSK